LFHSFDALLRRQCPRFLSPKSGFVVRAQRPFPKYYLLQSAVYLPARRVGRAMEEATEAHVSCHQGALIRVRLCSPIVIKYRYGPN
jgi:hypothetical protein